MLTFRHTNIFFALVLTAMIGYDVNNHLPFYFYLILLVIYSAILFYGCTYIQSNFFLKVNSYAVTDKKEIAISFDDGPVRDYTPTILQLLKQQNIKAAFFCIGNRIPGNEDILKMIISDGHIIGNHSFTHDFWFDMHSTKKMLADLQLMDNELKKATGLQPLLFRPPYGVINPNLKNAIIEGGYIPVGWNVRSMDTVIKEDEKLLSKITNGIKPGAVFLFHDAGRATVRVLPAFLQEVKKRGYQVVPLDKLLHLTPYA